MLVTLVAAVDISPLDGDAGQALDLLDLPGQGMAVIGVAGQCLHADDELAAGGARVGDRDRCLHPELVAAPRLALGDAFHLGSVQGIKLVRAARLLGEYRRHSLAGDFLGRALVEQLALRFEFQHFAQRQLRPLGLAGKHSFAGGQRCQEDVGVGPPPRENALIALNRGVGGTDQREQRAEIERGRRKASFVIGCRQWRLRPTITGRRAIHMLLLMTQNRVLPTSSLFGVYRRSSNPMVRF